MRYNGEKSHLFVNSKEINKFKAKDFEIVATPLYTFHWIIFNTFNDKHWN